MLTTNQYSNRPWSDMVEDEQANHQEEPPLAPSSDPMVFVTQLLQQQLEQNRIKPIEIPIPSFSGDIKQYHSFKSTFNAIIKRNQLGYLEKLALLRSKLEGEALQVVLHLDIKDNNYEPT